MAAKAPRLFRRSSARNSGPIPELPPELVEGRPMRLNKYLAHAQVANRRMAENLIKGGLVQVNGEVVKEPGAPVNFTDVVLYQGQQLRLLSGLVYVLVNQGPGVAPTNASGAANEPGQLLKDPAFEGLQLDPIFPRAAGVLGLSLLTNDEQLTDWLRSDVPAASVQLRLTTDDELPEEKFLMALAEGIEIEGQSFQLAWHRRDDGAKDVAYRIEFPARQLDELKQALAKVGEAALRCDVMDLVGLDKRDLPRGFYRFLQAREIRRLRHFS